jgi:hypothetical protein
LVEVDMDAQFTRWEPIGTGIFGPTISINRWRVLAISSVWDEHEQVMRTRLHVSRGEFSGFTFEEIRESCGQIEIAELWENVSNSEWWLQAP